MKSLFCNWVCLILMGLTTGIQGQSARIVFYNVENLFDVMDDTLTNDEEFLPEGDKNWTYDRFREKTIKIYRTLVALGQGDMPAVIGLCEVENRLVLNRLIYDTPLSLKDYRLIHRESHDARGVDVALIYRADLFFPITSEWLTIPLRSGETTREILHVKGRIWDRDTLDIYINHWPSRYGGAGTSVQKRMAAAAILSESIVKVLKSNYNANIIVMGDFNDEPDDESMQSVNKILENSLQDSFCPLVNLSSLEKNIFGRGTIKHQGVWSVFDQILVSCALFSGDSGLRVSDQMAGIFMAEFLLEPDNAYSGMKPFRTYLGPGYHGGFSDHMPVFLDVEKTGTLKRK
ncbi:MAG TPA: endonuclease [Bacteroidales bacterium]|nr:endonuclease [Bacteroidales bacterium]